MRIQIYTAQTVEEALALADLGVDNIGLTPSDLGLPGEISIDRAAEIARALRGRATSVALSVSGDVDEIARMARAVGADILHLCANSGVLPPDGVLEVKARLATPIMQAIAVTGPEAVDEAARYAGIADYLILDSDSSEVNGIGAAGVTHDWAVSAEIVRRAEVPVILAGGLDPDNVAEAIAAVRPWAVDSLTRTNRPLPGGGFVKDLGLVAAFVRAARAG